MINFPNKYGTRSKDKENMKDLGIMQRKRTCLVVIDAQERFRKVVFEFGKMAENVKKLVESFRILNVPVIFTEQNPEKLGRTIPEISGVLGDFKPIEKLHFSCFGDRNFEKELKRLKVKDIVLCGLESHVCVLKTALDGMKRGYNVHVVYDAVSSRKQMDRSISMCRISHAGIFLTTTESVIFQLMDRAGTDEFRKVSRIVK
jgi:nicotinamidase-related amidase